MNLKAEAVGLAVKTELPIIITDIQRAGPSTGMPTKPEQADLLMAMYGRHGESPIPIIAASTPGDCFDCAYEAVRIAVKYMTPVILLTDGQLANGAEPWLLPNVNKLPEIKVEFRTDPEGFLPYLSGSGNPVTAVGDSGNAGLEHRIGGLSSEDQTGNVSYSPANNELMVRTRARKMAGDHARDSTPREIFGDAQTAERLACWRGWGSTYGSIREASQAAARQRPERFARPCAVCSIRSPADPRTSSADFKKVMVAEMNMGQLLKLVRADYLIDAIGCNRIQGRPFKVSELTNRITRVLEG